MDPFTLGALITAGVNLGAQLLGSLFGDRGDSSRSSQSITTPPSYPSPPSPPQVPLLSESPEWQAYLEALRGIALQGQLPQSIQQALRAQQASLFAQANKQLKTAATNLGIRGLIDSGLYSQLAANLLTQAASQAAKSQAAMLSDISTRALSDLGSAAFREWQTQATTTSGDFRNALAAWQAAMEREQALRQAQLEAQQARYANTLGWMQAAANVMPFIFQLLGLGG